ncbi:MAG: bifunctional phosphopantothenoylcysteine decarboxylase/phosphopantothenate--cysteine ligase CoaBC [Myxococcales bacterium]|nr:bifunctional phosphopantothenoylcysteine decarboxylase/phosphopantothenate--cysteine ligase CoaBC [Myxococcales bacterium]
MAALEGKRILLGVTGGIAAYKAAELCRLLVKDGAHVRVVMTAAAEAFVTPMTMQTLSGHKVARHLLDASEEAEVGHIRLADEADLVVVAPATADAMARFAGGLANDLLSTVVLASRAPVLLAPAMNVNMWENLLTQANLGRLLDTGRFFTVGPESGPLACGWIGAGRMIEPELIRDAARAHLTGSPSLAGKRVVVTAGPTHEPVDDVRFLGNRSSGKMGFALAAVAAARGARVTLVAGPVQLPTPGGVEARIDVETALEMHEAVMHASVDVDVVVMTAAVADFRPVAQVRGKLSRREGVSTLELTPNPDILADLGRARQGTSKPVLVGFAAEVADTEETLRQRARAKLQEKRCDVVIANDVSGTDIGFGSENNAGWIVRAEGPDIVLPRSAKRRFAEAIWDHLAPLIA